MTESKPTYAAGEAAAELKACPFCPSTDTVVQAVGLSNGFVQYAGSCNYCGARGQAISSELSVAHAKKYAALAWNTRYSESSSKLDRLIEKTEQMEAELRKLKAEYNSTG